MKNGKRKLQRRFHRVAAALLFLPSLSMTREPNYDEAKVAPYSLEDPLTFADGTRLTDVKQWPARRAEIVRIFEKEMYGRTPPKPDAVVTELREEGETLAGQAIRRQYRMWFKRDRSGPFIDWLVVIPNRIKDGEPVVKDGRIVCENESRVPVVLLLNYRGNQEFLTGSEVFMPEGVWVRDHAERFCFGNKPARWTRGMARETNSASPCVRSSVASPGPEPRQGGVCHSLRMRPPPGVLA